ncbi:Aldehyde dehydrogenase [Phytophthora nicotianae]|uniref:aldehyde dehydrogenase (NAD(+)) n=1 Tax=Phytophthora nicotianae TaxID=4792 RepID=A0A0W8CBN3_PHYNI|nr:Aldehyde dehydrogenase [Phytophthora nicotianae]
MQRQILRQIPRVQASAFAVKSAATAAKTSPLVLSRHFSTPVSVKQTNLLINGEFVPSIKGKTFETFNPATEEKIADVAEGGTADIDAAVTAARAAFDGPWRTMSAEDRGKLIYRLAELIEENIDELAALEALDNGKPCSVAKAADLGLVIKTLRYYAGWPDKIHGSVIPVSGPYLCYTKAEPVGHPDVDKVAFTGSTEVGYQIMRTSHVSNLKRITLELGGKSANIILDDADIDLAIQQSQLGLFMNQGQCCIAGTRVYVQEGIYDEFVRRTVEAANARVVGDPFDAKTDQGSQIDETQFEKILGYIEEGKKEGAKLLAGGKRHGNKGWFIEPTVFSDVTDDMTIAREEIFGPVMSILKFKTIDEVIARANDSVYGLGAGVVTSNIDNAIKISNGIRTGTVYVNCYDVFDSNTPFGGFKDSGIGRENGELGLRNYLEHKTVIIKRPEDSMP